MDSRRWCSNTRWTIWRASSSWTGWRRLKPTSSDGRRMLEVILETGNSERIFGEAQGLAEWHPANGFNLFRMGTDFPRQSLAQIYKTDHVATRPFKRLRIDP